MPRIRTIKPEFYRHHDLYLAEQSSRLPIRIAFSGLWLCADKEGRFKWKPRELKLDILPYDELDFNDVLNCLVSYGFIIKYTVENKDYGAIPTFKEHQRITGTEKQYDSKLPPYDGNNSAIHDVSKEIGSIPEVEPPKTQLIDLQTAFQDVSKETLCWEGKDNKERIEGNRKDNKEGSFLKKEENVSSIKKNKSGFNTMPIYENFNGLPENKTVASVELVRITTNVDITKKQVYDMWEVFKIQTLTGKRYYPDEDAVYSHFINWIKTQKFNNGNNVKGSVGKKLQFDRP